MTGAISRLKALEAAAAGFDCDAHSTPFGCQTCVEAANALMATLPTLVAVAEAALGLLEDDVAGLIDVPAAQWDADLKDIPEHRLKLALEALAAVVPPEGRPDLRTEGR